MSGRILELISRVHLSHKRRVARELAPYAINPKQVFLLRKLKETGGLAPSAIAELLFADRPTVTSMLGTLERAGWVTRRGDPGDGRRVVIEASAAGVAKLASVPEGLWRTGRTAFDPEVWLDAEERRDLRRLLEKLADALEERC